jgi:TM2 domain-containing membrane protein YozV
MTYNDHQSSQDSKQQKTDEWAEEQFLRERMRKWNVPGGPGGPGAPGGNGFPHDMYNLPPRKSKFVAGLLSLLVPGTGQLYVGYMQRGITIMLVLALDICAIVATADTSEIIPLVVLFSLLIPVIYFYNVFDALQLTDRVNGKPGSIGTNPLDAFEDGGAKSLSQWFKGNNTGYLLIGAGGLLLLFSNKPSWIVRLMETFGSTLGAILLIAAGLYMFFRKR